MISRRGWGAMASSDFQTHILSLEYLVLEVEPCGIPIRKEPLPGEAAGSRVKPPPIICMGGLAATPRQ